MLGDLVVGTVLGALVLYAIGCVVQYLKRK